MVKFIVTRDVSKSECPWLPEDLSAGFVVNQFVRCAFGCITPDGTACTFDEGGGYPFFELPKDAVAVFSV